MTQSVPGLVWSLLIILASGLIGCMLAFAAEASTSKAKLLLSAFRGRATPSD
jgi:hypothetical protein